jgi:formylglycine-generating enzyme required for sulfatase activity
MVIVPVSGGGSYCIDAYEVSRGEYNGFVAANPVLSGLPASCASNTVYAPAANWPPGTPTDGRPVTNVDWCDAYAYCVYSGKHLCGRIAGGTNDPTAFADASQSEWFNACSAQSVYDYPYGDTFVAGYCQGAPLAGCPVRVRPAPPAPTPSCLGGVTGLYEMSGNAAEWEDSCNASDGCRIRGGSCGSDATGLRCDDDTFLPRLTTNRADVGFRCCL